MEIAREERRRVAALIAWLAAATSACGGGYDAEHDCEQSAACEEALSGVPVLDVEVSACVDGSEGVYDAASADTQELLDDVADACGEETGCAWVACACSEAGVTGELCDRASGGSG